MTFHVIKLGLKIIQASVKKEDMGVKLDESDMVFVGKIHDAITQVMSEMPHEIMKSNRYGAWAVTALTNILCKIFKMMNLEKEKVYQMIDDIWDNQDTTYKILN